MEGRNQGRPLETELAPDLLFKPSTIHGSTLHAARRREVPKTYPSRLRNSFAHRAPFHLEAIEREGFERRPSTCCLSRSSHRNRSDRPSCASCRRSESIRCNTARKSGSSPSAGSRDSSRKSR
jgi:hypothetical protein